MLALVFWQWRPLLEVIWNVRNATLALILQIVFFSGWAIVLISTFLINHFDLFGLRQVYLQEKYSYLGFRKPGFYKFVRHPIMLGLLLAFWATPEMTAGHLLFAIMSTAYILVGVQFEERDLIAEFGATYQHYRQRVPMLLPRIVGRRQAEAPR